MTFGKKEKEKEEIGETTAAANEMSFTRAWSPWLLQRARDEIRSEAKMQSREKIRETACSPVS